MNPTEIIVYRSPLEVFFVRMFMIGFAYGILYVYHLVLNGWLM